MNKKSKYITVGRLGASYGVRGWIKVNSFTEERDGIFNYQWYLDTKEGIKKVEVEEFKVTTKAITAKLDCINSLEEAKLFNNNNILVLEEDLPKLEDPDEVYWKDLLNCSVYNTEEVFLGKVRKVEDVTANDVLMVAVPPEDNYKHKWRMIPFIKQYVLDVDVENKKIIVDWDPDF